MSKIVMLLRQQMKLHKENQTQAGERLGYHQTTISSVLRGYRDPTKEFVEKLVEAYGLPPSTLEELLEEVPPVRGSGFPKVEEEEAQAFSVEELVSSIALLSERIGHLEEFAADLQGCRAKLLKALA